MSHVILNIVYRLRMYSVEYLAGRGLVRRVLSAVVRAPLYFDELWSRVYGKVLDGVELVPEFGTRVEDSASRGLLGPEAALRTPRGTVGELKLPPEEGLVQKSVRYSGLAESRAVSTALFASLSLQRLQRSLEGSVLTSSLLAGFLVTIALLFLVLRCA